MPTRPPFSRYRVLALSITACMAMSGCVIDTADSSPQQASLPLPPVTTTVTATTTATSTSTVTAEPVTETMYIIPDALTETVTVTPEPVVETVYPEPVVETVYPEPVVATVVVTETVEVHLQQQGMPAPPPVAAATYYPNCTAARAAGVTPIYQGEPGYGTHLDRDGDGIACE